MNHTTNPQDAEPAPVCQFTEGCHRVVPCSPGCGTPLPAVSPSVVVSADRATLLDEVAAALTGRHCSPESVAIVRRLVGERLCATCQAYGQTVEDLPDGGVVRRCKDCNGEGLRRVAAEEQPAETQWPGERCGLCPPGTRTRHLEDHMVQVHGARPTARPAVGEQPDTQTREADRG